MKEGRILVVDDDLLIRELVKDYLVLEGYEVKTAEDGEEAKQIVKDNIITLLVTDCYIGKDRGTDLYKELKTEKENAKEDKKYSFLNGGVLFMSGRMDFDENLNKILDELDINPSKRFNKPIPMDNFITEVNKYHQSLNPCSNQHFIKN